MQQNIKLELWKAIHNKLFCFSIVIGMFIASMNVLENYGLVNRIVSRIEHNIINNVPLSNSCEGCSLFVNWIAVNRISFGSQLFQFIWPVLAAMPYGWSFSYDCTKGIYNQLATRSNIHTYYFSKYCAAFISGGVCVAFPLFLNLMLNAVVCPYCVPNVNNSLVGIFDGWSFSELFYTYPWIHSMIWIVYSFLLGGSVACLSFLSGRKMRFVVLKILFPLIVLLIIDSCMPLVYSVIDCQFELSPLQLVFASTVKQNPEWILMGTVILFTGLTYYSGYRQVTKHEVI